MTKTMLGWMTALSVSGALVIGCGGPVAMDPDGGPRDAGRDGAPSDAPTDARPDGNVDTGVAPDAFVMDDADVDADLPDAFTETPDAFTETPDAFVETPDAFVPTDAFVPMDAFVPPTCGNGAIDAGEECDGTMLGGATCASEIGAGATGTLVCAGCVLDVSSCQLCGDGAITGTEACDGSMLGGQTCVSQGFTGGVLACSTTTCALDTSGCTSIPAPSAAGAIVITEIMQNPATFPDTDSEWFEVHNPGATALELAGCVFTGTGTAIDTFTVGSSVVVAPSGYATFAVSTTVVGAPGFTPTYRYPRGGFALANSSDGITLTCGGTLIDAVLYDGGATFPSPTGASMTLDPAMFSATSNDAGANWCLGLTTIGTTTDRGTPGAPNDACAPPTIGFCRLQAPTVLATGPGATSTVYGRVYLAGLTDLTGTNDPSPMLVGAVGVGPDGSDPATSASWTWASAAPNAGYGPGSPAYEMNNDEYQATLTSPAGAGSYDFAYRFSADGGSTWVVCDGAAAGSSDGYMAANAGDLTVTAAAPTVVSLLPSPLTIGVSSTGILELTISSAAPAGGLVVTLSSSGASVVAPASVTVPAGSTRAGIRVRGAATTGSAVVTASSGASSAMATVDVVATPPAPVVGDLVFNEILYDPPGAMATDVQGDANCTASRTNDQSDEYVEVVNVTAHAVLLTGVAIWDQTAFGGTTPNFVFPAYVLGPGEAVLVYGQAGGTSTTQPWCVGATSAPFHVGDAAAFAPSVGNLSLNNGAETIHVTATNDRASTELLTQVTTGTVAADQAWTRSPDVTGAFSTYSSAPGHLTDRAFSPGTRLDGRPFADASAP